MEYLWDKADRGDAKLQAIHFSKPTFRSVSQITPRITVAMSDVSKLFILRVWLSARPEISESSAIHEAAAFSLRSRQVLDALNIRKTQSARSNILEQTIASSPSHSQNNVYTCVPSTRPQDSLPGTITMSKFRLIFIQYPYSIGISLIVESLERTPCRRVGDEPKMYKCGRAANQTCMSRDYF